VGASTYHKPHTNLWQENVKRDQSEGILIFDTWENNIIMNIKYMGFERICDLDMKTHSKYDESDYAMPWSEETL
jgi:hypothetical protein